jgi:hypothetical protein
MVVFNPSMSSRFQCLREIVGNIVREEMSGALCERIIRNGRKLVRREIHGGMMTQDLD